MAVAEYAPIVLFTYNRLFHTQKTIASLRKNPEAQYSDLIIFSDGPKEEGENHAVNKVRAYLKTVSGFKSVCVYEQPRNLGLANSIIQGVNRILDSYEHVIVLEDDLETSPGFLSYMNSGLRCYEDHPQVASIHGYVYPLKMPLPETFFIRGTSCWGWATWRSVWCKVNWSGAALLSDLHKTRLAKDFDYGGAYPYTKMLKDQISGKNNSWAIRWHAWAFLSGLFTLYPRQSLVRNIGHDGSGVHCGISEAFEVSLAQVIDVEPQKVLESESARKAFSSFFKELKAPLWRRVFRTGKRMLCSH